MGKVSRLEQKMWYLEYSRKQKCFHVDTIERIKEMDLSAIEKGCPVDYEVVAGPMTFDEIVGLPQEEYRL